VYLDGKSMILELGKFVSFAASILSLYMLMGSAFFVPGSSWEHRLIGSLLRIVMAAGVCFASGILFREDAMQRSPESNPPITSTLPVRLFCWSLLAMALLFPLSWFLVTFYIPQIWKNQPW
jgi:hypothetical protein